MKSYQRRIHEWMIAAFGIDIARNVKERAHQFLEAHGVSEDHAAEEELDRIWRPEIISKIRAKRAAKPDFGALPTTILHELRSAGL